ncbi:predicted protein [Naegleria gruberi]|uniref:Predicted protein n=1 Tax=Naegleria gruberi TaxID=5762 RepID=D2W4F7_NAEGR|nr:uncharacterized protein NAEGRDRAFT_76288 [Naegleria gruberi]EFC36049.1 predicted protein [Naegleria gruberi]|eukprot:XP_002668793.1 predicted protein [Naegleria gruberi strain NEG-M]
MNSEGNDLAIVGLFNLVEEIKKITGLLFICWQLAKFFLNFGLILSQDQILNAIGKPVMSFVVADFEDSDMEEVYPNEPVSLKEGEIFKLYGKIKNSGKETAKVAVSFRYGSKIYHIQELDIPTSVNNVPEEAAILPTLWAQQKIDSLSAFPQLFKDDIKKIGQEFRIVTDNTSLIVLETLSQYQKHDIVPPKTLTEVYKQFMQVKTSAQEAKDKQEKEKLERIISMWKERVNWHKTDFKLPEEKPEKEKKKLAAMDDCISESLSVQSSSLDSCCRCEESRECCRECCRRSCAPSPSCARSCCCRSASPSLSCSDISSGPPPPSGGAGSPPPPSAKSVASQEEPSVAGTIKVKAWTPDAAYCTAISQAKDPYEEYVKQRESYRDSPAFYLDVADYFLSSVKNKEVGVRILTNVSELELENVQLYRIVGYRLDQAEELELAEWVFERVKSINGFEPQSYRDLALVKERMGKYEEAMELFNRVIVGKWDLRFDEIEMTVATEMNHLLLNNPELPIIDKRLVHKFDLDIRISMAWDTDNVDIDLHVQEPGRHGEHAYYAHNRTRMGGYVSRDFRQGYGPEEYMLKKAQKGAYKATTNYFSNRLDTCHFKLEFCWKGNY